MPKMIYLRIFQNLLINVEIRNKLSTKKTEQNGTKPVLGETEN